jgi:NAD(P)H-flavin reductase
MIAGGTGITPCYQIIKSALSSPKDKVIINLIYSNSTMDDILLKDELTQL